MNRLRTRSTINTNVKSIKFPCLIIFRLQSCSRNMRFVLTRLVFKHHKATKFRLTVYRKPLKTADRIIQNRSSVSWIRLLISKCRFWWKIDCESQKCSIMFDNQMYLIIIWQLLPVFANFYLVFLFGVFDRLFDKIIDFEWSNAPLDWEIKFWNFIFPSHELIIDLEIVIRSFFDIAQIHQRRKKDRAKISTFAKIYT